MTPINLRWPETKRFRGRAHGSDVYMLSKPNLIAAVIERGDTVFGRRFEIARVIHDDIHLASPTPKEGPQNPTHMEWPRTKVSGRVHWSEQNPLKTK